MSDYTIRHLLLLFFLLVVFTERMQAQNLVPNPSFEEKSNCPSSDGEIAKATGWTSPLGHSGTPDYYSRCSLLADYVVPKNNVGYQQARTGDAYAGIFTYHNNVKEYLQIRLKEQLNRGQTYKVSFYVSAVNNGVVGTDKVGLYFSEEAITGSGSFDPLPVTPQIQNAPGNFITDTLGWTLVTANYMASGGEAYLTIGNFFSDADSPTKLYNHEGQLMGHEQRAGYIYVDDVSVERTPPAITILGDTLICAGEETTLFASGELSYRWHEAKAPLQELSSTPTLKVAPKTTTTYVVEGSRLSGQVTVHVVPLPEFSLGKDTTLCEGQTLKLAPQVEGAKYSWQDFSKQPYFTVKEAGTYWVAIQAAGCVARDSITVSYRDCTPTLLLPNVITPNGDGLNDTFRPIESNNVQSMRTTIYNRWGNQVFQTEELLIEWDGTNQKGSPAPTGTYFWLVQYADSSGKRHTCRGIISIIR